MEGEEWTRLKTNYLKLENPLDKEDLGHKNLADIKGFSIPRYNNIMNSESTIIEVETNKCRDMYGAGYIGDFHHFVEALGEYKKDDRIDYKESI